MLFGRHPEYKNRYGRHFWARGYYAEAVGSVNEEAILLDFIRTAKKRGDAITSDNILLLSLDLRAEEERRLHSQQGKRMKAAML